MMKEVDGSYVAAQVRLVRQIHKGTILILEGETDERVFDRLVDRAACDLEIAFGKQNVLEALDLLEEEGFPGVVAVVDADFDRVLRIAYKLENLCMTDAHDLDLTIFLSKALDRYLAEHADPAALRRESGGDLNALRLKIITASLPMAYCRFMSEQQNLSLYFKDLRHDEYVHIHTLVLNTDDYIAAVISRSSTSCTGDRLRGYIANDSVRQHDPYQMANGHDVAAILGIALRKLLGNRRSAQTWASEIEAGLRLAFDWEAFLSTKLFRCLKTWEATNKPYRIFRIQPAVV